MNYTTQLIYNLLKSFVEHQFKLASREDFEHYSKLVFVTYIRNTSPTKFVNGFRLCSIPHEITLNIDVDNYKEIDAKLLNEKLGYNTCIPENWNES